MFGRDDETVILCNVNTINNVTRILLHRVIKPKSRIPAKKKRRKDLQHPFVLSGNTVIDSCGVGVNILFSTTRARTRRYIVGLRIISLSSVLFVVRRYEPLHECGSYQSVPYHTIVIIFRSTI